MTRDEHSEEIACISVTHHMSEDDIIRVIAESTGVTVPETDDLLETLTDAQVEAVYAHMAAWGK